MNSYDITVHADWDAEAEVWIATNEDIGLVTEAGSIEQLRAKLPAMVEDLLVESHGECVVSIEIIAHSHAQAVVRRPAA